jgi:transcriptional regulator GlxA family with amidase domain
MDGELKASLSRFWTGARAWNDRSKGWKREDKRSHPSVRKALLWMEQHYRRSDAQQCLYKEVINLSPNHFRLLFSRQAGVSVSTHLLRLRMQEAMNLLRTSSLSIKEIAAAVGFKDPLYFSKRFHDHWDIAPTRVRN